MLKNKFIYIALSVIVSVILIAFLLSQIKTEDLTETFRRIYLPAVFAYVGVALAAAGLRAWRYKWLLQPQPITWGNILLVTFVRNSLIDLLPARIGSLSYIYILNKRLGFSFERATSTFVLAFILDFLTLSPFLVFSILAVGLGSTFVSSATLLWISTIFFLIVFLIFWKVVPVLTFLLKLYSLALKACKLEGKKGALLSIEKSRVTIESLAEFRARKISFPIFILSLFIRLAKYVSIFFLFYALLRSHGFSFEDLSFWKLILGTSGAELTSALPVKGLAGFGTWESAWALTFKLMAFEPRLAIISGIGVHLLTNVFEYSLGIASIFILALPYLKKARKK